MFVLEASQHTQFTVPGETTDIFTCTCLSSLENRQNTKEILIAIYQEQPANRLSLSISTFLI